MKNLSTAIIGALLASAALCASAVYGQSTVVLLNDQFTDSNRTVQNLPTSAAWYGTTAAGLELNMVEPTPGSGNWALQLTGTNASARSATAYFTDSSASPITLSAAGQKLTASFDMTITSDPANLTWFRLGLQQTGSTRYTADSNANLSIVGAYRASINLNNSGFTVSDRTAVDTTGTINASSGWTNVGSSTQPGTLVFVQNTTYSVSYEIERIADGGLIITYSLDDGINALEKSVTLAADSSTQYSFDTFAICWGATAGNTTTGLIDNVLITYTIPEPALAAGLLGLLACVLAVRRARR